MFGALAPWFAFPWLRNCLFYLRKYSNQNYILLIKIAKNVGYLPIINSFMDIRKFLGVLLIFKVSWLLYNCVLYVCHKIEGVTDGTSKKPEDIIPPTDDKQDKKIAEFQHYEEREKNLFKQIESERAISQQNNEIIREFEEILNQVLQDRNKLYEHKTLALQHLANIEYSFYDVTTKYERAKRVVEQYRENETALLTTIQNAQRSMNHQEEKYNKLKKHAHEKLTEANIGKQNPFCLKMRLPIGSN